MNDDFLHALRQEPSPEFAERLKARLRAADAGPRRIERSTVRWLALAASVAAIAVSSTFPSVRAGAQAFLDLFRVSTFAGVAFDPARLASLGSSPLDWPTIIGEQVEVLQAPSEPVSYATPEEAGAAAGIRVYQPTWTPRGIALTSTMVAGGSAVRFTASTAKLQLLLATLGIDDVTVPAGVDGQQASVRVPPFVTTTYGTGRNSATLVQARSPDVSFPAGLDVAALAEIALRILGLDRDEASRFAQMIDWRTTLVVPVPVAAASFRETFVQSRPALMIESAGSNEGPRQSLLLWSDDGNVYALAGPQEATALLEMAQTLQ